MIAGFIEILIGIGIIIYNSSDPDFQLVIKGTDIDFGYLIIAFGIFSFIKAAIRGNKDKVDDLIGTHIEILKDHSGEILDSLNKDISKDEIAEKFEEDKNIPKETTLEYIRGLTEEVNKPEEFMNRIHPRAFL